MDNILNTNTKIIRFTNLPSDTILTTYNNITLNSKWRSYLDINGYYMYPRGTSTPPHSIIFPYTVSYINLTIFYIGANSNATVTINSNIFTITKTDYIITLKTRTNQLDFTFNSTVTDYSIRIISYS